MKTVTNRNPMMSFLRKPGFNVLKAAIAVCLAGLLGLAAGGAVSAQDSDKIDGVSIMPGIERLSFISGRFYGIRQSYDDCLTKTQGVIPLWGDCADEEFEYQSKRLDTAYRSLLETLAGDETSIASAKAAQEAWQAFSDKDCPARAGRFGSTPGPATLSICTMESTARRAQQLEDWRGTLLAKPK